MVVRCNRTLGSMRVASSLLVLCLTAPIISSLKPSVAFTRQAILLLHSSSNIYPTQRNMTASSQQFDDPPLATSSIPPAAKRTFDVYPYGTSNQALKDYKHTKVVHFVRHAIGTHNVHREYRALHNLDARLTDTGQEQCRALAAKIAAANKTDNTALYHLRESAQLVVTSPLTRCIQTATISFQQLQLPVMAHPAVRETVNYNCDRRRTVAEIAADFDSTVDFSQVLSPHDDLWAAYEESLGCYETYDQHRESGELYKVADRGRHFFEWLDTCHESHVVVCSHAAFLRCLWNYGQHADGTIPFQPPQTLDDRGPDEVNVPVIRYCGDDDQGTFAKSMHESFLNCELRSVVVAFAHKE